MKVKTAILGIDLQNDFTDPSGSLFVNGADEDVQRIASFIDLYGSNIDYIALSLDSHQPIHIANQFYWKNSMGLNPPLFTVINVHDVEVGNWIPQYNASLALDYLKALEQTGVVCTIWPSHCIMGSRGWAVNERLINSISDWCLSEGRLYDLFFKGMHQTTEHYSIFKAAVEYPNAEETKLNTKLLNILDNYDKIFLVGEAADFCVVNSLTDMLEAYPHLCKKIIVLTDCMSWIDAENERAKYLYEQAKNKGVEFLLSTSFYEQ